MDRIDLRVLGRVAKGGKPDDVVPVTRGSLALMARELTELRRLVPAQ